MESMFPPVVRPDIAFFASVSISTYKDLDYLESEIRRLLKCSSQRTPVCMTTEAYARFRCKLLQATTMAASPFEKFPAETVQLAQGLVALASFTHNQSKLLVLLGWEGGTATTASQNKSDSEDAPPRRKRKQQQQQQKAVSATRPKSIEAEHKKKKKMTILDDDSDNNDDNKI